MPDYLDANRRNWNERVALHLKAYDVEGFRAGRTSLWPHNLAEVGDVRGKRLLHLQCHFGMDTMSWEREGAIVTGVDFSEAAIAAARQLAAEVGSSARFILSDVYRLPEVLDDQFDIVFASLGAICWLPDLPRWTQIAARYVTSGGLFSLSDDHPLLLLLDATGERPLPGESYFHRAEPYYEELHGSYVGEPTPFANPGNYSWAHDLGEIVSSVINAGLRLEFLREWPKAPWRAFPGMIQDDEGYYHLPHETWPLMFSLRARRDA